MDWSRIVYTENVINVDVHDHGTQITELEATLVWNSPFARFPKIVIYP
jgi:hypothetical protein